MSFEKRIASIHPALLTIVTVAGSLFFSVFTASTDDPLAYRAFIAVIFFAFVALGFLWLWSIYAVASVQVGATAKWTIAFLLTPLLLAAGKLLLGDNSTGSEGIPAMLLRFASGVLFIACVWKAAEAFEIALSGKGAPIGKIGGTAVFLFFSIIGAWALRERILVLVASAPSTRQTA
ncbi:MULTISPECIES: hypothetical protein [Caulobacter]|jgi:hypothetical protein|uniref:Uncharacterized protein n=1 Tax=Caulobacter vibrioides OR37 TaxID=1292034 RepID=R0EBH7_CAUVI|nr:MULTISPECIES: hypothetical protein [Caulobacter]ENZ82823.1 hypothetical protein OR37_01401 [Caulobacter vibrioides OR37]MBQ1560126.1 hypothetical protein [Caulobacter sp.]